MKRILTSPDSAELGLLKNVLQKAGIRCVERNEMIAQTLPSAAFQAELWIEDEALYPDAVAILEGWQHPPTETGAAWTCSRCGERLENQFTKCWKCGTRRVVS